MRKLFLADLKMIIRNRQSLIWALIFPLLFTTIFGLFFGEGGGVSGSIIMINKSVSPLATSLDKGLEETGIFKIEWSDNLEDAQGRLERGKVSAVLYIPETFAIQESWSTNKVDIYYDPASAQAYSILSSFVDKYLTQASFQSQGAKQLFEISAVEVGSGNSFSYFDFVLSGVLGLALMNASIIGIAISISKYREDQILKRITTTPLPTWKFILSEVLSRLILNIFQIFLILFIGVYIFDAHIYGNVVILFLLALLGGILFQLIGFVLASFAKTADAAQGMAQAVALPMMFLAGVFFPIDSLPDWLASIVQYLPLAPLLRMIRSVALDAASPFDNPANIIIVLSWIVVALVVAILKFRLSEE